MLGVDIGTNVLYVGDHLFPNLLSSKRKNGWRKMIVVAELEVEVDMLNHPDPIALEGEIQLILDATEELDKRVDRVEDILVNGDIGEEL